MSNCSAPWYELNISAPDNVVSACCYYSGEKELWEDAAVPIDHYWNGKNMMALRRIQARSDPSSENGCSSCFFYKQTLPGSEYYDFSVESPPAGLSPKQNENWLQAKSEKTAGIERVECSPLRIYANFGFACNLSCTMCHQVPRRQELKRQVLADSVLAWKQALERCMEMCVIGGEPFALPEALKFIRKFVAEPDFEPVHLSVFTNGTVLHKHWDLLKKKSRLNLAVSLDSIGPGYEKIRLGGKWSEVEANLLAAMEIKAKEHPGWSISTTANIQKAGIPYLADYARWHVKHGIRSFLCDFISAPGVEDTFRTENILHNPQLLSDIPRWRDAFEEASEVFRSGGSINEANLLDQYRLRVEESAAAKADQISSMRRQRTRNDWVEQTHSGDSKNWANHLTMHPREGGGPIPTEVKNGLLCFIETRIGDHFSTPFLGVEPGEQGGYLRIRASWPKEAQADAFNRLAHIVVQNERNVKIKTFREYLDFGFGKETILTAKIPPKTKAIRAILTPLGEDTTVLPGVITIDFDADTQRVANYVLTKKTRSRKIIARTRKRFEKWFQNARV